MSGQGHRQKRPKQEIVCRCNNISRATIEEAIKDGCQTMNEIFDQTTAGVGPCGGSCRRKIMPLLEAYLETGIFPEKLLADEKQPAPPVPTENKSEPTDD